MASSFAEAFSKSFQAEMARRRDVEAEVEREKRLEERAGRERALRNVEGIESEQRQEAAQIERELRLEKRMEEARERGKIEESSEAASGAADRYAGRALDFRGDWKGQIKALGEEEAYNARADVLGIPRIGGGADVVYVTPEQRSAMARAEEDYLARQKREGVFSEAKARAMAQIKAEGTPEGKALKSDQERKANLLASRSAWREPFIALSAADRAQIDTEDGMPTTRGLDQLSRRFTYRTVERVDPVTNETTWVKIATLLRDDIKPLESGATGQKPEAFGPTQQQTLESPQNAGAANFTGFGFSSKLGAQPDFLRDTESYLRSTPFAPYPEEDKTKDYSVPAESRGFIEGLRVVPRQNPLIPRGPISNSPFFK